jgi:hypothetical protein
MHLGTSPLTSTTNRSYRSQTAMDDIDLNVPVCCDIDLNADPEEQVDIDLTTDPEEHVDIDLTMDLEEQGLADIDLNEASSQEKGSP